jgi:hypothetical protein
MKRAIIAVVAGLVTFTGIYGLAASLNLSTSSLGAGTATVAACQAATINVTYTPSYAATIPGYAAGTVTANNLQATCYSMPYRITLYGAAGASLGEVTGTTPAAGTTFTASFATASAAAVTGVALVISG